MSLEEIIDAISLWKKRKNDSKYLKQLLSADDSFDVSFREINHSEKESIHAYPGIVGDQITLFVIHADRDTKEQAGSSEGILPHIQIVRKLSVGDDEPIPDELAERRIINWQENHSEWIVDTINTNGGLHSAFSIPTTGMEQDRLYRMYFALKLVETNSQNSQFDGDLVLWDFQENAPVQPNKNIGFLDTVRLVPPFGGSQFFLLKSATID